MPVKGLTNQEHRNVLERLVALAKTAQVKQLHSAGPEYTSLMVCFLTHNLSCAESVLRLHDSFGDDYFPSTVGYALVRPMFEIDVLAHYITQEPSSRAHQYIAYGSILKKHQMDSWGKHRKCKKPDWREAMEMAWQAEWAPRQTEIDSDFESVRSQFVSNNAKGKVVPFRNWSGKSIRQMAIAVDHEEAYDIFYADLSSFAHADVRLANRFLHLGSNGMSWSSRAHGPDIGSVFRYADIFFTCFLGLFGKEFKTWPEDESRKCWS